MFVRCDVSDREAVDAAVETTVPKYGTVDILFHNAGTGVGENFPDEDDECGERVIAVNLSGTLYMSRTAWSHMIEAGVARS